MARWDDLTQRALGAVDFTQSYLRKYKFGALDPAESARIDYWSRLLDQRSWQIRIIDNEFKSGMAQPKVSPQDELVLNIVIDRLDIAGPLLQSLHFQSDYAGVDRILSDVDQHLGHIISLHTHGPGDGEPE